MKERIVQFLPGDHPWQNQIFWYTTIDSTNTEAKRLAAQGVPHGTVLIADEQTGGRGRMGRSFQSPAGTGIYMSVILRPNCKPREQMHLTCAAAVATCDAVEKSTGLRPGIKWTNDLVYSGRKLAGILTELSLNTKSGLIDYAVIGIGINCLQAIRDFPPELHSLAGSLAMFANTPVDRAYVAACLIHTLYRMDTGLHTGKQAIMERYRKDCITIGNDISLLRSGRILNGHAMGVDDNGALIVVFSDGTEELINSGEVSVRGLYGYI